MLRASRDREKTTWEAKACPKHNSLAPVLRGEGWGEGSPTSRCWLTLLVLMLLFVIATRALPAAPPSFAAVIQTVQPKLVKIYGAGGGAGLEAYQTGFLISPKGHVLTVWSYVLDSDIVTVTLDDGRRLESQLVGADPRLEIAILKIPAEDLPHFKLDEAVELQVGDRVLAFSNLFGVAVGAESTSVQHGSVTATTQLSARRGAFETPYRGNVYVVDAMTNNPGAAGGALTNRQGSLAGLLGKELRNALNNTWLNHAIPVADLQAAVADLLAGKTRPRSENSTAKKPAQPWTLWRSGITLMPPVLTKTPPFAERVRPDSPAENAGLQPDDLILFVNDRVASSCQHVAEEISFIDRIDPLRLTVQRGQELLDLTLKPTE
ncbi:MAG: S1C family serine protease [Planctomycetota bacterium]|nr:S1C family serine protease [Planctomycetota bacterium]